MNFDGQVAIVTGAGDGLGKAYAIWLAERGAAVVVNNRKHADRPSSAQAVVAEIKARGGKAVADEHAVEDTESGKAMVKAALDAFGRIDIVICNAAVNPLAPFHEYDLAEFRRAVDINLWGTIYVVHAAWPKMLAQGYGRIVLTSSTGGLYGFPNATPYSTTKAALFGFARALTWDVPPGIDLKINVVTPGAATRMLSHSVPAPGAMEALKGMDPARLLAVMQPEKVAPAVGWLASKACTESGMTLFTAAGKVLRVHTVEGAVVDIPDDDFNIDWPTLNSMETLVEEHDVLTSLAKLLRQTSS